MQLAPELLDLLNKCNIDTSFWDGSGGNAIYPTPPSLNCLRQKYSDIFRQYEDTRIVNGVHQEQGVWTGLYDKSKCGWYVLIDATVWAEKYKTEEGTYDLTMFGESLENETLRSFAERDYFQRGRSQYGTTQDLREFTHPNILLAYIEHLPEETDGTIKMNILNVSEYWTEEFGYDAGYLWVNSYRSNFHHINFLNSKLLYGIDEYGEEMGWYIDRSSDRDCSCYECGDPVESIYAMFYIGQELAPQTRMLNLPGGL